MCPAIPSSEEGTFAMSAQVLAALIAAIAALVISILGLLTASAARRRALIAEDSAKQTEVVRAKGLSAAEEVTFSLGKLLEVVRTMRAVAESDLMARQDFVAEFGPSLHKFGEQFINAYYRSATYLDEPLASEFAAIRQTLIEQPTSAEGLNRQFQLLETYLTNVARFARAQYLPRPLSHLER